jgi:ankyrin repeat protein
MGFRGRISGCCLALLLHAGWGLAANNAPLADAAMKADRGAVRSLLNQQLDVNGAQPDGTTALHWAVRWDDLQMADELIRAGASVTAVNRNGVTPLHLAAVNGKAPMFDLLLKAGADPNAMALQGEPVIMTAARTGASDAIRVLLGYDANVNAKETLKGQTALMWAAAEKHPDVIRLLIEHGADVHAQSKVVIPPPRARRGPAAADPDAEEGGGAAGATGGLNALMFGARRGDLESVQILLKAGTNINQTMGDGSTAILLAILNGHFEVAAFLLEEGADLNMADSKGLTPLYAAVDMRNLETSEVPGPVGDKLDPLELIKSLLRKGANTNARLRGDLPYRGASNFSLAWQRMNGATPFLRAAQSGDITVMRLLLSHGADPQITTADNTTALMLAAGMGWGHGQNFEWSESQTLEAVKLCVDLGIDVNAVSAESTAITAGKLTALHAAAQKGSNATVEFLVSKGADLNAKDGKGRTPLVWAEGVPVQTARPPWPQPHTAVLLRQLMSGQ